MCNASNAQVGATSASKHVPPSGGVRLEAQGLACRRGMRLLFTELSFAAGAGQALVVVGPNGAGKSSLLRIIAGLLAATSGRVTLVGGAPDTPLREQVHYLGHDDALKGTLTVRANLGFWRDMLGRTGLEVEEALDEVGLDGLGGLPAAVLSAGQKRRLAIARLLVSHRAVWVLDEPTTALDAKAQARFAEIGRAHLAEGGIILAATHAPLDLGPSAGELTLGGASA